MSFPLLMTKLHIPHPRPGLISRPRLLKRMNESATRKMTLISAPAGFGKSALMEQWAADGRSRVSWLSLDASDNDPTRFWSYVIAAFEKLQAELGKNARALLVTLGQSLQPFPNELFITTLLNEIMALSEEAVLVLDDYHLIENPGIHEGMIYLVDHLPPSMHIIFSSRMDPPFPLARLRARSEMVEVRADDLRFTFEETTSFLKQEIGLDLSPEQIVSLDTQTEGWIAGLQLAALSLEGHADPSAFIASFTGSHRFILDYLVEEVLQKQPEDIRSFLLQTSILSQFTGPLCDAVTGRHDSQAMLERLQRSNLFLISLDEERRWFRYHHLFADLLHSLLHNVSPERLPELHRRSADWFEQNGLVDEAFLHWISSGDVDRAAGLLDQVAERLLHRGEWRTLIERVDALPEILVRPRPSLFLYHTWVCYLTGRLTPTESVERLREIEETVSGEGIQEAGGNGNKVSSSTRKDQELILGQIMAARTGVLTYDVRDSEGAIASGNRALQLLPEEEIYWRSVAASCLAGAYEIHGDIKMARQALVRTSLINRGVGDNTTLLVQHWREAHLFVAQGKLHNAAALYREILHRAEELGWRQLPIAGYTEVDLGDLLREWNDPENANHHLRNGIAVLQRAQRPFLAVTGSISLARLKAFQKDYDGAFKTLASIDSQVEAGRRLEWQDKRLANWKARIELMRGDIEAAVHWAEESGLDDNEELRYADEPEYLTFVRVLIARARTDSGKLFARQALHWLDRLAAFAEEQERSGSLIEILMLRALALTEQQDTVGALSALEHALSLAVTGGYIRLFVDEGETMRELLSDCRSRFENDIHKPERDRETAVLIYIDRLLSAFNNAAVSREPVTIHAEPKINELVEPLSPREMEVIRLVAAGLSTEQIAEKLFITLGTVRNHLKSIYGKLNAHSRVQAVKNARDFHLL